MGEAEVRPAEPCAERQQRARVAALVPIQPAVVHHRAAAGRRGPAGECRCCGGGLRRTARRTGCAAKPSCWATCAPSELIALGWLTLRIPSPSSCTSAALRALVGLLLPVAECVHHSGSHQPQARGPLRAVPPAERQQRARVWRSTWMARLARPRKARGGTCMSRSAARLAPWPTGCRAGGSTHQRRRPSTQAPPPPRRFARARAHSLQH